MNEPIVELHEQVAKLEANLAVAQSFARRVTRLEPRRAVEAPGRAPVSTPLLQARPRANCVFLGALL